MSCPRCNSKLDRVTAAGVELDQCTKCGGIWLDRGEMAKLTFRAEQQEIQSLSDKAGYVSTLPPLKPGTKLSCPICTGDQGMVTLPVGGASVDMCQRCGGTWMDGGVLEVALRTIVGGVQSDKIDALLGIVAAKGSGASPQPVESESVILDDLDPSSEDKS
jgi:Zn-finger nucleic acid-binding protein